MTWNELELNLLRRDEIFNESLILAQDERWRKNVNLKTVKGIRKLVVFLTWNELELNLLRRDEIFNESLILAQDERWRRA